MGGFSLGTSFKAFRGTLLALLALGIIAGLYFAFRPAKIDPIKTADDPPIFAFEKHEMTRAEVKRPDGSSIAIAEQPDGKWIIEGTDFEAAQSMVNRFKHQLHQFSKRAGVEKDASSLDNLELYGLGKNATFITATLRSGQQIKLAVGDPTPADVSYYVQNLETNELFTVKRASVDYAQLTMDEFRERRFATFDSKDATGLSAKLRLPDSSVRLLEISRLGEGEWEMVSPLQMSVSDDKMRRLLGRVSALKADSFIEPGAELEAKKAEYGLTDPRADITVRFSARDPLRLLVGNDAPSDNPMEELAYMMLAGQDTIFVARRGLLEEFGQDPAELRNRQVVQMKSNDVVAVDVTLKATAKSAIEGEAGARYQSEQWMWEDGVPIAGSTPERTAKALSELDATAFVQDAVPSGDDAILAKYGLTDPLARAVLLDREGNERVVLIGAEGEPETDPEGHSKPRYYATVEGSGSVYLVSDQALERIRDLVKERNRKAEKDEAKAERRERIPGEALPEEEEGEAQ